MSYLLCYTYTGVFYCTADKILRMDCCIRNMKVVVSTVEGYMEVEEILSFCLFSMCVELGGLLLMLFFFWVGKSEMGSRLSWLMKAGSCQLVQIISLDYLENVLDGGWSAWYISVIASKTPILKKRDKSVENERIYYVLSNSTMYRGTYRSESRTSST